MVDQARAARLAQRIKVLVAEALRKRVKDERAEAITLTEVRVTNDLQHATVYYTVLGDAAASEEAREVLAANHGALRHEVGRQLTIRLVPTLEFVADEIPETAAHLEEVLAEARARDAEVARLRENATYAGDADPYKKDGEDAADAADTVDAADGDAGPAGDEETAR